MRMRAIIPVLLFLAAVTAAPGIAGAQVSYCDYCHEYIGSARSLNYSAKTVAFGGEVSFKGKKDIKSYAGPVSLGLSSMGLSTQKGLFINSIMVNTFNYDYPSSGINDFTFMYFGDAAVFLRGDPEYSSYGNFIVNPNSISGHSRMNGFIVLSGYVYMEDFYIPDTGMPEYTLGGTGTVLMFDGSATYVGRPGTKNGNEIMSMKYELMPGSAAVVDVQDGEMLTDTLKPASVDLKVSNINFIDIGSEL